MGSVYLVTMSYHRYNQTLFFLLNTEGLNEHEYSQATRGSSLLDYDLDNYAIRQQQQPHPSLGNVLRYGHSSHHSITSA